MADQTPKACKTFIRAANGGPICCVCAQHEDRHSRPAEPTPASETTEHRCKDVVDLGHHWLIRCECNRTFTEPSLERATDRYTRHISSAGVLSDEERAAWNRDLEEQGRRADAAEERIASLEDDLAAMERLREATYRCEVACEAFQNGGSCRCSQLFSELPAQEARADRLERALEEAREVARDLLDGPAVCNCDEAYTSRGLHEPNAVHADYADAFGRLRALVSTEGEAQR